MANNMMGEVRETLLETLRGVRAGKVKAAEAKAVAGVAQTLINSYTLQVRVINALGGQVSGSLIREIAGEEPAAPKLPAAKPKGGTPPGEGIHAADPLYSPRKTEAAAGRRA
ncbi:MAG: hypothetical protein ABSE45_14885 [Candidatus Acidiferrales bacterium]|jgi:hypothetical protein